MLEGGANILDAGANCNDLDFGLSYCHADNMVSTVLNHPIDAKSSCIIITESSNGTNNPLWKIQTWKQRSEPRIWQRSCNSGVWGPWTQMATTDPPQEFDFPYVNELIGVGNSIYFKSQDGHVGVLLEFSAKEEKQLNSGLIGYLPIGFRPNYDYIFPIFFSDSGGAALNYGHIHVLQSGEIQMNVMTDGCYGAMANFFFIGSEK